MDHLNYCRQVLAFFKLLAAVPDIEPGKKEVVDQVIDLCRHSKKFLLPTNGKLLLDPELRALDETVPLRLPHPVIALEFISQAVAEDGSLTPVKRIIFCRESAEGIYIRPAGYLAANGFWSVRPECLIPKTDYLDRSDARQLLIVGEYPPNESPASGVRHVHVVLGFLNALACSNVRIERSEPKNAGKKIKAALPFDTYHVLTIDVGRQQKSGGGTADGSNRHPREHLRRGHIRRLEDGRRIWVNATVVAAGRGVAKIEKDYMMKNSTMARPAMPQAQRCGAAA